MLKSGTIAVLALIVFCCPIVNLKAGGTREEAKELVTKAIKYYKGNGKDNAFGEISNPRGMFVKDDLYIFVYDLNGVCMADGSNKKLVGKNLMEYKDHDGKFSVKERINIAKTKGIGWQDYRVINPITYKMKEKTAYVEKVDDYIFCCGVDK